MIIVVQEVVDIAKRVQAEGFNVYALINKYRRLSKISPQIPDEVILRICKNYLINKDKIKNKWPWFLKTLAEETRIYFAKQNVSEHAKIKKEPVKLKITIG